MCSDFFYNSKINFVQSIIVFIIDALVFLAVNISFSIYSAMPAPLSYIKYAVLFFALMYLMMHLYIYPLMITFKLSLKDIYKNAVLLAFAEAPKNILLLIILLIVHFIIPFNLLTSGYVMILLPIYILLEIFGFIGLSGFMVSFFTYPSINMLIDASEKIYNPDDEE